MLPGHRPSAQLAYGRKRVLCRFAVLRYTLGMDIFSIMGSKPVLIGLHLGFAIIGIDAFLWLFGEIKNASWHTKRLRITALIGVAGFALSWLFGGYYYVKFYGELVKPVIKGGLAPWAHNIIMETKEHIFLFIIPLALTALFITFLKADEFGNAGLRGRALALSGFIALLGLAIGLMGFVISAAARWG